MDKELTELTKQANNFQDKVFFSFIILVLSTVALSFEHSYKEKYLFNILLISSWIFLLLSAFFSGWVIRLKLKSYFNNHSFMSSKNSISQKNKLIQREHFQIKKNIKDCTPTKNGTLASDLFKIQIITQLLDSERQLNEQVKKLQVNWEEIDSQQNKTRVELEKELKTIVYSAMSSYLLSCLLLFLYHSLNIIGKTG